MSGIPGIKVEIRFYYLSIDIESYPSSCIFRIVGKNLLYLTKDFLIDSI